MGDLETLAGPLAAELRERWPLPEGELESWLARVLELGEAEGRAQAVGHRCLTVADLVQRLAELDAAPAAHEPLDDDDDDGAPPGLFRGRRGLDPTATPRGPLIGNPVT